MNGDPPRLAKVWNSRDGWFQKILREYDEQNKKLPCFSHPELFDRSDTSPISRYAAAQVCLKGNNGLPCPIRASCLRAGSESRYVWSVWGGFFEGKPVPEVDPEMIRKWLKRVRDSSPSTEAMLRQFSAGIPKLGEVLSGHEIEIHGECLRLRANNPKLAMLLRRELVRHALMLAPNTPGTAKLELSCAEYTACVSPWHIVWNSPRSHSPYVMQSRCVALAMHLAINLNWKLESIEDFTGISKVYVSQLKAVAEGVGNQASLPLDSLDAMHALYLQKTGRKLGGMATNAAITLMQAASELSCITIGEILEVGKVEL